MLPAERLEEGQHVMTVCNACRYCEGYCPVFPGLEHRVSFAVGDLMYLANLCHNCGECLYACQYAPPHEFGINVPGTLARIRLASYEACCWPRFLGAAFRHQPLTAMLALAAGFAAILAVASREASGSTGAGDFYQVVSHDAMVALFGTVSALVLAALAVGCVRFCRTAQAAVAPVPPTRGAKSDRQSPNAPVLFAALRDVFTLRHLHGGGVDCPTAEDVRTPWRRWFHHATFYGFVLCFASTSVAALYHLLGWRAPYAYTSLPVLLGTLGGVGLLVGPVGLLTIRSRRDRALNDSALEGLDGAFTILLLLTSVTGLLLLVWRARPAMPVLLIVHLGLVLALFLSLPYGKFVHGVYRAAALLRFAIEDRLQQERAGRTHRSGSEAA